MTTPRDNNMWKVRGRLVRDPYYARKDGDATPRAVMFRIAASRPFTNRDGDLVQATDYVEVKVFNLDEVARLESSGLNKGAMVAVSARAASEHEKYEKDGEEVHVARLVAIVETSSAHSVDIEQLGRTDGEGD